MRMSLGYQSPKVLIFMEKKTHNNAWLFSLKTYNNIGTYNETMVKQLVCSLKGAVFEWYIDLPGGSIDSWDQLDQMFQQASIIVADSQPSELAQTEQIKEDSIVEYF
ncbi:Uncharacterized protein Adt_27601 [Abeliophyllum distichum]|uniref:Retrotransposon gag domain-containing protein n=1 Tax=Abeliophyllum distichum TaxID=126358 RepID=A0ABD1RU65_9LAMI